MITMYEGTIGYYNVCSSAQDHIIKFWLQSQVLVSIHQAPSIKERIMVLKWSIENLWRLRRWYE